MKIKGIPNDIEPCCELCEYATKMEATGEFICKYKHSLKKTTADGFCKSFSFNIFAYKPKTASIPKVFNFTKI